MKWFAAVVLIVLAVVAYTAIPQPPVFSASEIMKIQVKGSLNAGKIATFGLPIAEGRVDPGDRVFVARENGDPLTTQWNKMAYWRTDGSVLHGVVSFVLPEGLTEDETLSVMVAVEQPSTLMAKVF